MNDAEERFVRRYAHLPPDAPLDRHAARVLLRRALANREALAEYLPARVLRQLCKGINDAEARQRSL